MKITTGKPNLLTYNSHSLQHTVNILQPFEQLLHDIWLVKVGPQRYQNLLVEQDQLAQLRHLALDVPHQGLVEQLDTIRTCKYQSTVI